LAPDETPSSTVNLKILLKKGEKYKRGDYAKTLEEKQETKT